MVEKRLCKPATQIFSPCILIKSFNSSEEKAGGFSAKTFLLAAKHFLVNSYCTEDCVQIKTPLISSSFKISDKSSVPMQLIKPAAILSAFFLFFVQIYLSGTLRYFIHGYKLAML